MSMSSGKSPQIKLALEGMASDSAVALFSPSCSLKVREREGELLVGLCQE